MSSTRWIWHSHWQGPSLPGLIITLIHQWCSPRVRVAIKSGKARCINQSRGCTYVLALERWTGWTYFQDPLLSNFHSQHHCPIFVRISHRVLGPSPSHLENTWMEVKGFREIGSSRWKKMEIRGEDRFPHRREVEATYTQIQRMGLKPPWSDRGVEGDSPSWDSTVW